MKTKEKIKLIGEIDFKDIKVKVYNDPHTKDDICQSGWGMRNPDSCYVGSMFMNKTTGKITYPNDAIIPKQNNNDSEMLPQFIITGNDKIDDIFISSIGSYLDIEYKRVNVK